MNEQIKDLLPNPYAVDYRDEPLDLYTEVEMQKFAEKIIQECAKLVDNDRLMTASDTYDEVKVAVYETKDASARKILNHFGVKE